MDELLLQNPWWDNLYPFSDSFTLYYVEHLDINRLTGSPAKGKKLFFFDPFYYHVVSRISGLPYNRISRSSIIEGLVGAHLIRNFESGIYQGFSSIEKTFYWKSSKGKEVDFVLARSSKDILPIEVKYQNIINPADYVTIKNSFKKGVVASKNTFHSQENIVTLPVSSLLYIL